MDRFKFRYVFYDDGGVTRIEHHTIEDIENSVLSWLHLKGQTWTLLSRDQCTGLKDKSGKLIYEGDIFIYPDSRTKTPQIVQWHSNMSACWMMVYEMGANGFPFANTNLCEVIGNIHENPELLETS